MVLLFVSRPFWKVLHGRIGSTRELFTQETVNITETVNIIEAVFIQQAFGRLMASVC